MKSRVLLSDFAQQLRRIKADVPHNYFTLLDAAGFSRTTALNHSAKTEGDAGSLSISKLQKLQKLYAMCGAVYGPVLNLVQYSNQKSMLMMVRAYIGVLN